MFLNKSCRSKQQGVGLLEVLVALVILAVGLLGMAGMQASAKRNDLEAWQRSQAAFYVNDILERMRSNPTALMEYTTAAFDGITPPNDGNCTQSKQSLRDLCDIKVALQGLLEREGTGSLSQVGGLLTPRLCITPNASGLVNITLAWQGILPLNSSVNDPACVVAGGNQYNRQLIVSGFINPN